MILCQKICGQSRRLKISKISFVKARLILRKLHYRVLGIETSCDDTAAAVVDTNGNVLGESIVSQTTIHNKTGGIIPNVAKELHTQNIAGVVNQAVKSSNMLLKDLDGIAVTTEPGLIMSLDQGLKYTKRLASDLQKKIIPIHHMEAHALTIRMIEKVEFPFLVLLASGGHCLLSVVRGVDDFLLLGSSLDCAPGEAFDKVARSLKLWSLPEYSNMAGGVAIEKLSQVGDPHCFPRLNVATSARDCHFSFSGLRYKTEKRILQEYERLGLSEDEVLSSAADIAAWFQYNTVYHIARKLQRALLFCEITSDIGPMKNLVLSGGVASNMYLRKSVQTVCETFECELHCPPPKLCTDNGIMIAWNAIEKLNASKDPYHDPETIEAKARSPLGQDISKQVIESHLSLPRLRI